MVKLVSTLIGLTNTWIVGDVAVTDLKIGEKVTIVEHSDVKLIGVTGTLLSAETPRPAIDGQVIKWKVCKVKLDETGKIIDCLLSQLSKHK